MSIEFSRKRKSQVARLRGDLEELRDDNKILFEDCEQLRRERDEWKQRRDLAIERAEKFEVEIKVLRTQLDDLKRFAYDDAPTLAAKAADTQTAELRAEVTHLRQELQNIANAPYANFEDAEEFRTWARNRARHAIGQKPKLIFEKP